MLNARLAEQQKQHSLDLLEESNPTFLETVRSIARRLARTRGAITADDVRDEYDRQKDTLGVKPTSHNVWGSLFRGKEWVCVGYTTSKQVQGHGNIIKRWKLKEATNNGTEN